MRLGESSGDLAEDVWVPHHLWIEDVKYLSAIVLLLTIGPCHLPKVTGAAPGHSNGNDLLCLSSHYTF